MHEIAMSLFGLVFPILVASLQYAIGAKFSTLLLSAIVPLPLVALMLIGAIIYGRVDFLGLGFSLTLSLLIIYLKVKYMSRHYA